MREVHLRFHLPNGSKLNAGEYVAYVGDVQGRVYAKLFSDRGIMRFSGVLPDDCFMLHVAIFRRGLLEAQVSIDAQTLHSIETEYNNSGKLQTLLVPPVNILGKFSFRYSPEYVGTPQDYFTPDNIQRLLKLVYKEICDFENEDQFSIRMPEVVIGDQIDQITGAAVVYDVETGKIFVNTEEASKHNLGEFLVALAGELKRFMICGKNPDRSDLEAELLIFRKNFYRKLYSGPKYFSWASLQPYCILRDVGRYFLDKVQINQRMRELNDSAHPSCFGPFTPSAIRIVAKRFLLGQNPFGSPNPPAPQL